MANEWDEVLERVARNATTLIYGCYTVPLAFRCEEMLKRDLLPLLEAGQAMADTCNEFRALCEKCGFERSDTGDQDKWDAAKAKAMEGRP